MLNRLRRLPFELRVALIACCALVALNVCWALSQASWKIDSGIATLIGAVFGFAVVGFQTRRGFHNLTRSQSHQAQLDREARMHAAEIDENFKRTERDYEKAVLLAAIRAEIAAVHCKICEQQMGVERLANWYRAFASAKLPSTNKTFGYYSPKAIVFETNIAKIGLLGTNLGADVIKVLSKADGKNLTIDLVHTVDHDVYAKLYEGQSSGLKKWASDLFHVAMRIRAYEDGTPDPGTLTETQEKRYAEINEPIDPTVD
jgi:hypothetical protein